MTRTENRTWQEPLNMPRMLQAAGTIQVRHPFVGPIRPATIQYPMCTVSNTPCAVYRRCRNNTNQSPSMATNTSVFPVAGISESSSHVKLLAGRAQIVRGSACGLENSAYILCTLIHRRSFREGIVAVADYSTPVNKIEHKKSMP
ncbi:unnamed protein product [Ectocarpus sp. 12 AP-2014]